MLNVNYISIRLEEKIYILFIAMKHLLAFNKEDSKLYALIKGNIYKYLF